MNLKKLAPLCALVVSVVTGVIFNAQAFAEAPGLSPLVRNADGSIRHMNQYDAVKYCKEQGSRLPTAKEFAVALNPSGLNGSRDNSYEVFSVGEAAFLYNYLTYQRPEGQDEENQWLWSSSIDKNTDFGWGFFRYYGDITQVHRLYGEGGAIRCIK